MSICYEWAMDMALGILAATGKHYPTAISLCPGHETTQIYPDLPEKEVRKRFGMLPKPRLLAWAEADDTHSRAWLIVEEKHSMERHYRCIPSPQRRDIEEATSSDHEAHGAQHPAHRHEGYADDEPRKRGQSNPQHAP